MSEWEPPKPPGSGGEGEASKPEGEREWKSSAPPDEGIPLPPSDGLPPMPGQENADWLTPGTPVGGVGGESGWQPPGSTSGDPGGWLPPSGGAPPAAGGWLPPTGPLGGSAAGGAPPGGGGGWQPPGGAPPSGGGWQPPGGAPPSGSPPGGWQPPGGGGGYGAAAMAHEAGVVRVGDVLSSASRVVAGNVGTFLVVSLAAVLPGLIVTQFFSHRMQKRVLAAQADMLQNNLGYGGGDPMAVFKSMFDPADFAGICGGAFLSFVLTYLAQGILMYTTMEHLAGRHVPVGDAVARGFQRAPSIFGVAFLVAILQFVTALPGAGVGVLLFAAGPAGACCGMGFMFVGILVPMFWVLIATFVAIPTAVMEKVGPVTAIQRSFELTKGHRLTIFLAFLALLSTIVVFSCLGGICSGAAGGGGVDMATGLPKEPSPIAEGINFVMTLITSILQTMGISALAAVTYARIRGVKDGVDASALADVFS
ncbi:MAG: hypothetical protein H6721_19435 [Sandaracinus sp.]|nr:hypothetical protein [Sandaracinus sp.]MCB9624349.1 hypothetical protein [Sandaracinus sp.]MCB9634303.1 hypothetical protein [Sandaracinus sp.]